MEPIRSETALKEAIAALEARYAIEQASLKRELHHAHEQLTPTNIIRSAVDEISASQGLRSELAYASATLAAGFVSRKVVEKISHDHPRDQELGREVLAGATGFIIRNPELVRTLGTAFFRLLRGAGKK